MSGRLFKKCMRWFGIKRRFRRPEVFAPTPVFLSPKSIGFFQDQLDVSLSLMGVDCSAKWLNVVIDQAFRHTLLNIATDDVLTISFGYDEASSVELKSSISRAVYKDGVFSGNHDSFVQVAQEWIAYYQHIGSAAEDKASTLSIWQETLHGKVAIKMMKVR